MKKQVLRLSLLMLFFAGTIASCKKNDTKNGENYDSEVPVQSDDQNNFSAQVDAVVNDANLLFESNSSFSGRAATDEGRLEDVIIGLCNASFAMDSSGNTRKITVTYSGAACTGGYSRTGTVVFSMPSTTRWKNAGAVLTVSYQNLVITRILDNKSITINGTHTITNVSGGLLATLSAQNSITHTIASDGMNVKFGDGTERTWKVARQRVFTYNNGVVLTVTGTHTEGSVTNVAEWGTNRFGRPFTSAITQPLVVRQDCSFRLVSGQVKHTVPVFSATATFGLNSAGIPTSCPAGAGSYYVKIEWTGWNNYAHSVILPY
jgi:hypothetical protein